MSSFRSEVDVRCRSSVWVVVRHDGRKLWRNAQGVSCRQKVSGKTEDVSIGLKRERDVEGGEPERKSSWKRKSLNAKEHNKSFRTLRNRIKQNRMIHSRSLEPFQLQFSRLSKTE